MPIKQLVGIWADTGAISYIRELSYGGTEPSAPSATTMSPTEIVLVTVTVVIAVSVAVLAISKRHER